MEHVRPASTQIESARNPGLRRRQFLHGLGMLGAAALMPEFAFTAQTAAKPYRIDTHYTLIPRFYRSDQGAKHRANCADGMDPDESHRGYGPQQRGHLDCFDKRAECLVRRRRGCAQVGPANATIWREVDVRLSWALRDVRHLAAAGCRWRAQGNRIRVGHAQSGWRVFHDQLSGEISGDPKFTPIMEELNRRKAIAYTHPFRAECCQNILPNGWGMGIELSNDTTRTIASMLCQRAVAKFPDIRFIWSHAEVPYLR